MNTIFPTDWKIEEELTEYVASNHVTKLRVEKPGQVFKRNAIHLAVGESGKSGHERILVGELYGVRCYVEHKNGMIEIRLTTEDYYP